MKYMWCLLEKNIKQVTNSSVSRFHSNASSLPFLFLNLGGGFGSSGVKGGAVANYSNLNWVGMKKTQDTHWSSWTIGGPNCNVSPLPLELLS